MRLYRLLFPIALAGYLPFALLRQLFGGRRVGGWRDRIASRSWRQPAGSVWLHGVSVGEVGAARTILRELRLRRPDVRLLLSSSTDAGRSQAGSAHEADASFPFPLDLGFSVSKALSSVGPQLVVLVETELWPEFLIGCGRREIPVAVVNGRLSDHSIARYRRLKSFWREPLSSIRLFAMQTDEDARRIATLGIDPARIRTTGNVKFDVSPRNAGPVAALLRELASGRSIVVGGSTHDGEEAALLAAVAQLSPRPLLVLAPRRPERFGAVVSICERAGLSTVRRSAPKKGSDVVVLDSVGELSDSYAAADVAFIGGSLIAHGGQNPIEAWLFSVPVLLGPHTSNFREIVLAGMAVDAARVVETVSDLATELRLLMSDKDECRRRGRNGAALLKANRGAAARTAELLAGLIGRSE